MTKPSVVNLDIVLRDLVTPESCAMVMCEVMKHVLYQREQIPYSYDRLMFLMNRRKEILIFSRDEPEDTSLPVRSMAIAERQYQIADTLYRNLNIMMEHIMLELETDWDFAIEEIVFILGATPLHPQHIFRLPLPTLAFGHRMDYHPPRRHLKTWFQAYINCDELHEAFRRRQTPTNVFFMLKLRENMFPRSEKFVLKEHYSLPLRGVPVVNFFIKQSDEDHSCECKSDTVEVYCDNNGVDEQPTEDKESEKDKQPTEDKESDKNKQLIEDKDIKPEVKETSRWFQFSISLKGYRDIIVDDISVTHLWLKYRKPRYNLVS